LNPMTQIFSAGRNSLRICLRSEGSARWKQRLLRR
jgi:hypothetical protein